MILVIIGLVVLILLPFKSKGEKVEIIVEKGSSLWQVATQLDETGVIRSRLLFTTYAVVRGKMGKLQAGRYLIAPSDNIPKIVMTISSGLTIPKDTVITIPEGSNIAQIAKILETAGLMKAEDFLIPETLALEGYIFPDTYKMSVPDAETLKSAGKFKLIKDTINEILYKAKANFDEKLADKIKEINPAKFKEAVIIASILEKEVRTKTDMRLVAGIIKKRIALDMPLQLDATVAYGVCRAQFGVGKICDVSKISIVNNLKIDSLYNTYTRMELPAGPISNPGLQAIEAALNPQPSSYLYYLNARDGTTIYSKTGLEHEQNRQKYLK